MTGRAPVAEIISNTSYVFESEEAFVTAFELPKLSAASASTTENKPMEMNERNRRTYDLMNRCIDNSIYESLLLCDRFLYMQHPDRLVDMEMVASKSR